MNSLASATAISSGLLRAKRQVRAAEYVQPVPWVFWSVSVEPDIRGKGSAVVEDTGCVPSETRLDSVVVETASRS